MSISYVLHSSTMQSDKRLFYLYNRGMNTKKAIWLRYPENISISLHSYKYSSKREGFVLFTIGEEDKIELTIKAEESAEASFVLLHTPSDIIEFKKDGIYSSFFGLESFISCPRPEKITLIKNKESLSFFSEEKLLLTIKNPAFALSASFGARTRGEGKVYIEVF